MSTANRDLHGKTAIVTGGARGIGKGIATALANEGVRVAIGDIDAPEAQRTAQEIGAVTAGGGLDVSDLDAFTAFIDFVESEVGPLDVMVNNAGILPVGLFDEESDEMTTRQLDLMLRGAVHGTKQAVRRMKPRGSGHIINISSVGAWMPGAGAVTYSAAKFGVRGMSEALKLELHGTGV
jgi:NAD(P)-dependent dehydrogenase (short-subunit alcohol dehydrogenase family)